MVDHVDVVVLPQRVIYRKVEPIEVDALVGRVDPGDLDVLVEENLVAFETDGRSRRPYVEPDTIVQEPLVTRSFDDDGA